MATATNKAEICSLSLSLVKEKVATNIDSPETNGEKVCSKWYDAARRYTLAMHPWNFASKRTTIAQDSTAPAFGYVYQSDNLPSDFIRLLSLGNDMDDFDYEIEDNKILSDEAAPYKIRYVFDQQLVSRFSPTFVIALAHVLAAFVSYEFTGSATLRASLLKDAQMFIDQGAAIDGQQNPPKRIEKSKLNRSRKRYSRNEDAYYLGGSS